MKRLCLFSPNIRNHSFSMYATFSEKLKFLTPWHAHSQNKSTHCLYYIFLNAAEYIYSFPLKEWYFKNSFLLCYTRMEQFRSWYLHILCSWPYAKICKARDRGVFKKVLNIYDKAFLWNWPTVYPFTIFKKNSCMNA